MRRFLAAACSFAVVAGSLNAAAFHRSSTHERGVLAAAARELDSAGRQLGLDRPRDAIERLARSIGAGVAELDNEGGRPTDRYLMAGDSVMADIAPVLATELDRQTGGEAVSSEIIQKGSKISQVLWDWEGEIGRAVHDTGAKTVFVMLDVDAADAAAYRAGVDGFLDAAIRAGAENIVWIEHPVTLHGEFERGRPMRQQVLAQADRDHPELVVVDVSDVLVNSSGGYTPYITLADGRIVRVRQPDGIHLTGQGANQVARAVIARLGW